MHPAEASEMIQKEKTQRDTGTSGVRELRTTRKVATQMIKFMVEFVQSMFGFTLGEILQ